MRSIFSIAAVDLDPKVDETALDRHDGKIGRFGDEDGIDRRQAAEEIASALPNHFLVGDEVSPEITGQGNAGLPNGAHGNEGAGHATLHVGRTSTPQSSGG